MKKIPILIFLISTFSLVANSTTIKKDAFNANDAWQELIEVLEQDYAYLDRLGLEFKALSKEFKPRATNAKTKQEFADISQAFLRHFYDPHLNLGPYNESDYSVFPTGSDIRAIYKNKKFVIEDIKADAAADVAGISPGAEIVSIDNIPVKDAIEKVFARKLEQLSLEQINYGLNVSLGGYRKMAREIGLQTPNGIKKYQLSASYDAINAIANGPAISYKKVDDVGYIRFNNSLGNSKTVDEFKRAITELSDTKALIVDLRNTPSGGNTGVAEPILGHFVDNKTVYQLYQQQQNGVSYKDAKLEKAYVEPNLPHYTKPFVVLAGRWTGSMGEGMTIGLDAIGAVSVVGAPMADLLGGIKTVQLVKSDTWMEVGFERLYHVNKTFREDFKPNLLVIPADRDAQGNDPALTAAMELLNQQ